VPEWLHDRAKHILRKNPDMPEGEAFAIATQQAHALGKTPKSYGTPTGKHVAKEKYDTPGDDAKTAAWQDKIPGGLSDKKTPWDFPTKSLREGEKVEKEHTSDKHLQREISMDHLTEDPHYYEKLKKMEDKTAAAMLSAFLDELPKTAAYHGSPTANISTLEPRLDPRTGKTSLFTSKHPEHAAIHALLADRATANITHQTKGGKFISGHAITKEDLLPHGYLYELPGSGGELSKATKPTSSKKVTLADVKRMGWTFEKKASTKEYVRIQVDGGLQHHYLNAEKWDHPAGKIEVGEAPEQAARRELIERTGYAVVGKLKPMGRDGVFHVFSAQQVKKVGPPQTEIRWQTKTAAAIPLRSKESIGALVSPSLVRVNTLPSPAPSDQEFGDEKESVKVGYSVSQYSGPLSMGRFKQESYLPPFNAPQLKTAGPPSEVGRVKRASEDLDFYGDSDMPKIKQESHLPPFRMPKLKTAAEKVEKPHELFARAQSVRARMLPVMRREQKKLRALNLTGVPISSVAMGINLPDEGGSDIDLNIGTKNLAATSKKLEAVGFPHTATEHGYNIHKYQTPEGYDVELKVRHQHEVDYQRSAAKRISALSPLEKQQIIAQKYELRGDPAAYKKAKIDFYIKHGLIPPGGDWSKVTPKTAAAYQGSPKHVDVQRALHQFAKRKGVDHNDAIIIGGGALYLHGVRPHMSDVDAIVPGLPKMMKGRQNGFDMDVGPGGDLPREALDYVEMGGLKVQSLPAALAFYKTLNRPKDQQWIQKLEDMARTSGKRTLLKALEKKSAAGMQVSAGKNVGGGNTLAGSSGSAGSILGPPQVKFSPGRQLAKTQNVAKVPTTPPGPTVATIAKPVGYGTPMPGATKTLSA